MDKYIQCQALLSVLPCKKVEEQKGEVLCDSIILCLQPHNIQYVYSVCAHPLLCCSACPVSEFTSVHIHQLVTVPVTQMGHLNFYHTLLQCR